MEPEKDIENPEIKKSEQDEPVLRARDIIPGQSFASNQKGRTAQKHSAIIAHFESVEKKPENSAAFSGNSVPTFDLAEEIMAEQRKITAAKRTAPGPKAKDTKKTAQADEQAESLPTQTEQIIADIVARDIERICKSD